MTVGRERYVVDLPVVAGDLTGAVRLARVLARRAGALTQADPGETTVSAEDDQAVRHRVFCDLRWPPADAAPCGPTTPAPAPGG